MPTVGSATEPAEESNAPTLAFKGEEATYTQNDGKIRMIYDPSVVEVDRVGDGYPLRLSLLDKWYAENFYVEKYTAESHYAYAQASLEEKAAGPHYGEFHFTPEDKLSEEAPETTIYKMTTTYTNTFLGELEQVSVATGMQVYRFEEKYTKTDSYERISGPAGDRPDDVSEVNTYRYFVDLGDGFIMDIFAFSKNGMTLDKELHHEALETILNSVYFELVK